MVGVPLKYCFASVKCSLVEEREGKEEGRNDSGWKNFRDGGCMVHVHIFYGFSWTGGLLSFA